MLDRWLADLAEGNMEKTASAQFGEALDQLSVQELEALYELSDQKVKEAGWAARGMGALGGGIGGALGGGTAGAGLGGAMGALAAPSDRRAEGFWRGAGRGALLGAGVGGAGGALLAGTGAGVGGRLAREGLESVQRGAPQSMDEAAQLATERLARSRLTGGEKAGLIAGGLGAIGAPIAGAVGGGIHGAQTDPRQPVQRHVVATTKLPKRRKKEKKSHDLRSVIMEKAAADPMSLGRRIVARIGAVGSGQGKQLKEMRGKIRAAKKGAKGPVAEGMEELAAKAPAAHRARYERHLGKHYEKGKQRLIRAGIGTGIAAGTAGAAYGGYRLGKRKESSVDIMKMAALRAAGY